MPARQSSVMTLRCGSKHDASYPAFSTKVTWCPRRRNPDRYCRLHDVTAPSGYRIIQDPMITLAILHPSTLSAGSDFHDASKCGRAGTFTQAVVEELRCMFVEFCIKTVVVGDD